jgi:hypothetical protein
MAVLVGGLMAMLQGLANHFIEGSIYFTQLSDGEWTMHGQIIPSAKGNLVAGALADIILYGSQMVAQIMQVLVSPSIT